MDSVIQIGSLSLSPVDIVIFVICMISAVFCCIRGFVMELSKWMGIFIGLLSAIMFTPLAKGTAATLLPNALPAFAVTLVTFLVLWLAGFLVVLLLGLMLRRIVETFNLGALDNILGFGWGVVVSLMAVCVVVYLLTLQNLFDLSPYFSSSVIISRIVQPLLPATIGTIETLTQEGMRTLQEASHAVV